MTIFVYVSNVIAGRKRVGTSSRKRVDTQEAFSVLPPSGSGRPIFKPHVQGPPWSAFPFLCGGRTIDDACALRRHLNIHRVFHGTSKRRKKAVKEVIK